MDVAQRLQKFGTLYGNFHGNPAPAPSKRLLKPGATASRRSRNAKPGGKGGESARFSQGRVWCAMAYPQRPQPSAPQKGPARTVDGAFSPIVGASLFLQLPLKKLDFLRKGHVVADQALDLAHRVQDRRVIASAETPADLRERSQGEGLREIHRDLSRPHDIRGASR